MNFSKLELQMMTLRQVQNEGCVCQVRIEIVEIFPNVYGAEVRHDEWCPLLRSRDTAGPKP